MLARNYHPHRYTTMEQGPFPKFMLAAAYILNIGVWTHHFSIWLKVFYAILAGIAMLLGLINQWTVFYKTYHTQWIVVKIVHVFHLIKPKRHRNRKPKTPTK